MKIFRKIFQIIADVVIAAVVSFSCFVSFNSYKYDYVSVAGYSIVQVQSGSMQNSDIFIGDTFLIKSYDSYEIGDIIAFRDGTNYIFHEIVGYDTDDIGLYYNTKGSSNARPDNIKVRQEAISGKKISGKINWIVSSGFRVFLIILIYFIMMKYLFTLLLDILKDSKERRLLEEKIADLEQQLLEAKKPVRPVKIKYKKHRRKLKRRKLRGGKQHEA